MCWDADTVIDDGEGLLLGVLGGCEHDGGCQREKRRFLFSCTTFDTYLTNCIAQPFEIVGGARHSQDTRCALG